MLRPADVLPKTVRASLSLSRGDKQGARKLLDEVLKASPGNGLALMVQSRLLTADGDPISVAYSTQASGSSHTGSTVRVAATGPQAANVTGLIDQTDLYWTLKGHRPSKVSGHGHGGRH